MDAWRSRGLPAIGLTKEASSWMSESAFDGTLICDMSLEKVRLEDLLSKRVRAIRTEKSTFLGPTPG
jgi:hypothetical protein